MSPKDDLLKVQQVVERIAADLETLTDLPDEEAAAIIDAMQLIEDTLAAALAKHGIEIGDERID